MVCEKITMPHEVKWEKQRMNIQAKEYSSGRRNTAILDKDYIECSN
jgi:hypothetical protein